MSRNHPSPRSPNAPSSDVTNDAPTVYSEDKMVKFDANFSKQLSFNFCATRATRKKAAAMQDSRASRLRELNLDVTPTSFSSATTDRHELSRYVLEDLLSCKVGCRFIACIRVSASGTPTEASYRTNF
jgi:hypothetical protein